MSCKKIGLLGGRGYVGQEIISLLNNNNDLNIGSVYSSSRAGQPVKRMHQAKSFIRIL